MEFTKEELGIIYDSVKIAYGLRNIDDYSDHPISTHYENVLNKIIHECEMSGYSEVTTPSYVDQLIPF
jgi:hypothetical protein